MHRRIILSILYLLLSGCTESNTNLSNTKQDLQTATSLKAKNYFNTFPTEIIPYQIGDYYFFDVSVIGFSKKIVKNAFSYSKNAYTIEGYKDGMELTFKYKIKNPYTRDMFIPLPMVIITSDAFPKEENHRM